MEPVGAHFVLVHGACHGAWCWYKVSTMLRSSGHRVTAIDMAAAGVNPKQLQDLRSPADDFSPLIEFMEDLPPDQKVVLVGHSKGGVGISLAMEKFPEKICVAVFVTAFMFAPNIRASIVKEKLNQQLGSYMDSQFTYDDGPENPPTTIVFGPQFLASKLYQLSPPEDLTLATLLMRPVNTYGKEGQIDEIVITEEKYGSVSRVYVVIGKDNVLHEELQRWMIENDPPDDVMLIPDADHMVMFSKPQQLSSCLQTIADKWCF